MPSQPSAFGGSIGRTAQESIPAWEPPPQAPPGAPNVIYVLFDDVGFSDFGCYGSEIDTPNLDRLAANGLRFTNFHTTALCSPTRAALLTGRNHHSVGMGQLSNSDSGFPGSRGRIARSAGTIAEMLRPSGYNTFAVGKWHLTPMRELGPAGPYEQWPTQRGFDRYYGFLDGCANHWEPALTEDNHPVTFPDRDGYHLTEDLVDRSISLITNQQAAGHGKPFFLYLAFGAGHSPHHVHRRYIDKYVPIFEKGWDRTRAERLARQKAMGLVPEATELPPRNPGVRGWDELSADERLLAVRLQAAYAGMLDHTDEQIGRLLSHLDTLGLTDNTLIFVLSDNGASQEGSEMGTVHQVRAYFERAPMPLEMNLAHLEEIGESHLLNNYPLGWAMASNTPLKWYKQNTHGGGIRDPLIVHWPSGLGPDVAGSLRHQFHHVNDLTPTVLDVLGIDPPESLNGIEQQPLEGTSIRYTFAADSASEPSRKKVQYFEMWGHRGLVHEGWKAVTRHQQGESFDDDVWELYDLENDYSEVHDLAAIHADRLRDMIELWWAEAERYQVLPLDDIPGGRFRDRPQMKMVLRPGVERLGSWAAPSVWGRSFTITARIDIPAEGCEGVVIAHGDRWSGYSLYLRNGIAVFDYAFPMEHTVISTPSPLAPGPHVLRVEVGRFGRSEGASAIHVDGVKVADAAIPRLVRAVAPMGGLDIGADLDAPVGDYRSPFRFTGTIHDVVVEILDAGRRSDAAVAGRAELGMQ